MSGFVQEFKEFAVKGNVMDLAVGVIIGGAFGKIVDSLVGDLIMPIVGRIFGGLDFSNYFIALKEVPPGVAMTLAEVKKAGVPVFAYGSFITIAAQLHHPRLHHLHDGQADEPAQARRSRRARRPAADAGRRRAAARNPRRAEEVVVVKPRRRRTDCSSVPRRRWTSDRGRG